MDNTSVPNLTIFTTTNSTEFFGEYWTPYDIVIFILGSMLILLTLSGNMLVIFRTTKLGFKNKCKLFIVSLAVADSLVAVLAMLPLMLFVFWSPFELACKFFYILDALFTTSSIFHLTCLTAERYVAVCFPFQYKDHMRKRNLLFMVTSSWLLALAIAITTVTFGRVTPNEIEKSNETYCTYIIDTYYNIVLSTLSFYLPTLLMVIYNIRIYIFVRKVSNQTKLQNIPPIVFRRRDFQVAKTIGLMIACFLMCWLPYFTTSIIVSITPDFLPVLFTDICLWFGYSNSAINPYLYYFRNRH